MISLKSQEVRLFQEDSRDLQKGPFSLMKGASSSAKHPSKVQTYPSRRLDGGFTFGRPQKGLKRFGVPLKGLCWGFEGGLKGA